MLDDAYLLRDYAENHSEAAFAELVRRYVNLVYSAAIRRTNGDPHRANDVVQVVFNELARKPGPVARHPALAGWLHTATRNAAINCARSERRREFYEGQAALIMNEISDPNAAAWSRLGPVLDEVIDRLSRDDRDVVILRFFERRAFAEIGRTLRLSEDAARMRVQRALEKLRRLLEERGFTSATGVLATVLTAHTTVAAPAGLVTTAAEVALGSVAVATGPAFFANAWAGSTGIKCALSAVGVVAIVVGVTVAPRRDATLFDVRIEPSAVSQGSASIAAVHGLQHPAQVNAINGDLNGGSKRSASASDEPPLQLPVTSGAERAGEIRPRSAMGGATRAKIAQDYSRLLSELQLPADKREEMITLLVNLREAGADFAAAGAKLEIDVREDPHRFNVSVKTLREGIKAEMKALLGRDGYDRYLAAEEDLQLESYAIVLEQKLRKTPTPLRQEQAEELTQIIKQRTFNPKGETLIAEASRFLSASQLEALRGVQEVKRNGSKNLKVQEAILEVGNAQMPSATSP